MGDNSDKRPWIVRNLANMITMLGFPICFVLLWVVVSHREWTGTILSLLAGVFLTDFIDGRVARYLKTVGTFGGAADRLRDKLLLGIMFFFFLCDSRIHFSLKIITVPILIVETLLLVLWFMGVVRKMNVSASQFGRIKMFLLSIAILLCLAGIIVEERLGMRISIFMMPVLVFMFAVALYFGVRSFTTHIAKYRSQLPSCQ